MNHTQSKALSAYHSQQDLERQENIDKCFMAIKRHLFYSISKKDRRKHRRGELAEGLQQR